jgi:L-fuculose-phosphate aldolase
VTGESVARVAAAEAVVRCCRRLWEAGLLAGSDGNVSVRVSDSSILITPRSRLKAELSPADLVEVGLDGSPRSGFRRASTELDLHLRVYRRRRDVGAVVHAHPPAATGFALAGEALPGDLLPESIVLVGEVPVVPYATPGTTALGEQVESYVDRHDAVLLANHGAVTWGTDLELAQIRMEALEHAARIILAARMVGRVYRLNPEQIAALDQLRERPGNG